MATLFYQGHGSYRLTSSTNIVIYVDPFAEKGYDEPADLILITHQHKEQTHVDQVIQKPSCRVITGKEAFKDGSHQKFEINGIKIEAVEAYNEGHDPAQSVGYLITIDGVKLYAAGNTSTTNQMRSFYSRKLDYAILPADGIYNMDAAEAQACARLIHAVYTIPICLLPKNAGKQSSEEAFCIPGTLTVTPGEEIVLWAQQS